MKKFGVKEQGREERQKNENNNSNNSNNNEKSIGEGEQGKEKK